MELGARLMHGQVAVWRKDWREVLEDKEVAGDSQYSDTIVWLP